MALAPFTINFFANYQLSPDIKNIFTIKNYYASLSDMVLGMGIVFELPIVVFFLSRFGILTPSLMRKNRRYAIVIVFVIAAVLTPPDVISQFALAIPTLLLYEASIFSVRMVEKKRAEAEAARAAEE